MSVRVHVLGDKALRAKLAEAARRLARLQSPTDKAADAVRKAAARYAAKRTGRMAAATRATVRGGTAQVYNRTPYAGYQEYGTRYMNAHPFMRPAAQTDLTEFYEDHARDSVRNL